MDTPIAVGVTGHRLIRAPDAPLLRERVREVLEKLKAAHPGAELVLLDSIAIGTDTICAETALELGIRLVCPLPMPVEEYRRDFDPADAAVFDGLLRRASEVFVVPVKENVSRGDRYRAAGEYVADHCHVLLDLWDGAPGKPGGCGAAEIAEYALLTGRPVVHIFTPREGSTVVTDHPARLLERAPGDTPYEA